MNILFFTYGDSSNASTWSNIPYLMSTSFEKAGHTVQRVNMMPNRRIEHYFDFFLRKILRIREYSFLRTPLFKWMTHRKIRKNLGGGKFDICIFLSFEFYNKFSNIPSLLFQDWTYQMLLEERLEMDIRIWDRIFIKQQEEAIKNSEIVLPLFSETAEKLKVKYPEANICQIPFNVINNMSGITTLSDDEIDMKYKSDFILFIGGYKYISGLRKLIESVDRSKESKLRIEVIGMESETVSDSPEFVHFNGYLRKDVPKENEKYYNLLKNAKFVVNPTSKWAAYSSIVESMYFYNPVIITPFNQFVREFGEKIDFGLYIDEDDEMSLKNCIEKINAMSRREYIELSHSAHEAVKNYTWENYSAEMIKIIEKFVRH